MAKRSAALTVFGKDLDSLLKRAGKSTIREYADECGVSYKYILQLRVISNRRPGVLYTNLLKPFTRLGTIGLAESQQLSLRHRGKPLSLPECRDIFPNLPEQELIESIKQAVELKDWKGIQAPTTGTEILKERTEIPQPAVQSPYYRRVFVGRETELGELRSAFDNAILGQGSLVMVVGEPGIGKTVLCEQLAAYVSSLGGKSLVGHCYSERSLSLPYLAFVEVLRSYVQAQDVSELRKELAGGAADLGRIVPEIREKLRVRPRPKRDPEEERYWLMEAVTQFLGNIATLQPLLIVLEDLHNADNGTLEMLTHVSRNLAGIRLLLVGTYRDIEIDRTHPLSATLAELRRLPAFRRVLLRGLNADEVGRMLASIIGQEVPRGLVEAIHRQTEGNPLFIQEVIRYLFEEGFISPQGEVRQKLRDISVEMKIPDGLRDVIGKRLSRLSESCNRVLSVAAVIGRNFRLEVLQKVAGMSDEKIFRALEEARKAAVIEERTGVGATVNYRFAHAFFRRTLYEEIIAPRRIRLHQQVARALEEVYEAQLEEYAAELAEHFSYSSDSADLKKAVSYGETAAKRAMDVYAYGEAVRLLEQALKVQDILDPEDQAKLCDLTLALGDARHYAAEFRHILDNEAPRALALAETIKDDRRACRACLLAIRALSGYGFGAVFSTPEAMKWVKTLDLYAYPDTTERAWASRGLGLMKAETGDVAGAMRLLHEGVLIARKLEDNEAFLANSALYVWYCPSMPEYVEEGRRLTDEMARIWGRCSLWFKLQGMSYVGSFLLGLGERKRAEELQRELVEVLRPFKLQYLWIRASMADACYQIMDGRLEEATKTMRNIVQRGRETGSQAATGVIAGFSSFRLNGYLGRVAEGLEAQDRWIKMTGFSTYLPTRAYLLAHLGRQQEASAILDEVMDRYAASSERVKGLFYEEMLLLEAAVLVCHTRAAEILLAHLSDTPFKTTGFAYPTCVARHLGGAAALLGRYEEARKHYQEAIKVCTEMRFRPELALTRLQLAELLLEHYPDEKKEALEHLDFAIKEFRDMKMQPSLERALRHNDILKA